MRRAASVSLLAAAVLASAASAAEPPAVRLLARPAATAGTVWSTTLAVTPAPSARPSVVARSSGRSRTGRVTPAGGGRFRVAMTFPTPGRWQLEARVGTRRFPLGGVAVAPSPPNSVTEPFAVTLARDGTLLVADRVAGVLRLDPATGRATELGDVHEPLDVAFGPDGGVYVVSDYRIARLDPGTGRTTPVAGTGENRYGGDGGAATRAHLFSPDSVGLDAEGNVYVAEYENRVRRVDADTGVITTIAGNGVAGFSGDGRSATAATLHHPHGLAVAPDGTLYVADTANHRVRRVDGRTRVITTVAGTGQPGFGGDGGPAIRATFNVTVHVALGPNGSLLVSDILNHRIRRIGADGIVRTVAGNGSQGGSGDGGPATRASLSSPNQVAVAADGTFYVAEFEGRRVRKIDRAGRIRTLAR